MLALRPLAASKKKQLRQRLMDVWVHISHLSTWALCQGGFKECEHQEYSRNRLHQWAVLQFMAPVLIIIFNLSLAQSVTPTCFHHPPSFLPKKTVPALPEWLSPNIRALNGCSRITSAPHYSSHWTLYSLPTTIVHILHTILSHPDKQGSYMKLLFNDTVHYSSLFTPGDGSWSHFFYPNS